MRKSPLNKKLVAGESALIMIYYLNAYVCSLLSFGIKLDMHYFILAQNMHKKSFATTIYKSVFLKNAIKMFSRKD